MREKPRLVQAHVSRDAHSRSGTSEGRETTDDVQNMPSMPLAGTNQRTWLSPMWSRQRPEPDGAILGCRGDDLPRARGADQIIDGLRNNFRSGVLANGPRGSEFCLTPPCPTKVCHLHRHLPSDSRSGSTMDDGIHLEKSAGDNIQHIDLWQSAGHADQVMAGLGILGPAATVQAGIGLVGVFHVHTSSDVSTFGRFGSRQRGPPGEGHVSTRSRTSSS